MMKDIVRRFTAGDGEAVPARVPGKRYRELSCGHIVPEPSGGKAAQALTAQCKQCDKAKRTTCGCGEPLSVCDAHL